RDVAEDLRRGRIYLPQQDLARFGLTRADLVEAAARRRATPAVRELIGYQIARARAHYAAAEPGLPMLPPSSQPVLPAAFAVYAAILDEIERAGGDVFVRRAVVPRWRRLRLVARSLTVSRDGGRVPA